VTPAPADRPAPRRSTYRVQLHAGWTFDDAAALVPRLAALGISHLYCSPILQAASGSTHGYDVVDHHRVSTDLGGIEGLERLAAELGHHDMGLMIDIVPNHMARDGRDNHWWWDVLAKGPLSDYARHFDIEWQSADPRADWTVLVPILGDHYGRELEAGNLRVARDGDSFVVRYHDQEVPLAPGSIDQHLDDSGLDALNANPDALDEILSRQHYRLAHWRTANEELDYRRFFNIDTLIGLRTEDDEVFADVHEAVFDLMRRGIVDDLRIDHVDGLRDPESYLHRLRQVVGEDSRIVVEKILEHDERLPDSWPVSGTSGYEFAAWVDGVLIDPSGEEASTETYRSVVGASERWQDLVHAAKHQIMSTELASEVGALTRRLAEICSRFRRHRDHTRRDLHHAVREVLAGFDVYRTYVQPGRPVTETDTRVVREAVRRAEERRPDLDGELLGFIGELLLLRHPGRAEKEFAARFPQVAAPVMAKGVEDTAFYRYHRLISLCEVGGDPDSFGRSAAAFHEVMAVAATRWPETMLTLSTHDTKRSADVRARLNVLAEVAGPWRELTWPAGSTVTVIAATVCSTPTPSTCCTRQSSVPGRSTGTVWRRSPRRPRRRRSSTPPGPRATRATTGRSSGSAGPSSTMARSGPSSRASSPSTG
jgi:(1->4)-alpha-D-glucan 1-alpha-D-glucosylmutase